jgi:hypothetical protein
MVSAIAIYGKNFASFPEQPICPIIGPGRLFQYPGGFMHWLKLMVEGWLVFGVVTVVTGLMWTTHLSREVDPEIAKAPPMPERQFETAA